MEVKVLNTAGLGCGKGLGKLGEQLECVQGMLERFLASLQAAHVAFLDAGQFERWAEPSQRGNRRLAGLDLNKARNRTVIAAVSGLATRPEGFTSADLAEMLVLLFGLSGTTARLRGDSGGTAALSAGIGQGVGGGWEARGWPLWGANLGQRCQPRMRQTAKEQGRGAAWPLILQTGYLSAGPEGGGRGSRR